jgi:hypothetical protein
MCQQSNKVANKKPVPTGAISAVEGVSGVDRGDVQAGGAPLASGLMVQPRVQGKIEGRFAHGG